MRQRSPVQAQFLPHGGQLPGARVLFGRPGAQHGQRGVGAGQPRQQRDSRQQTGSGDDAAESIQTFGDAVKFISEKV